MIDFNDLKIGEKYKLYNPETQETIKGTLVEISKSNRMFKFNNIVIKPNKLRSLWILKKENTKITKLKH
jgi:hypothetical protein